MKTIKERIHTYLSEEPRARLRVNRFRTIANLIIEENGLPTSKESLIDALHSAESIKITVVFKQIGKGRRKQVSVSITPPNTCDLKNRPQDDIVRKLLKDWGIYVA